MTPKEQQKILAKVMKKAGDIYKKIIVIIEEDQKKDKLTVLEHITVLEMLSGMLAANALYNKSSDTNQSVPNLLDETMNNIRIAAESTYEISPKE